MLTGERWDRWKHRSDLRSSPQETSFLKETPSPQFAGRLSPQPNSRQSAQKRSPMAVRSLSPHSSSTNRSFHGWPRRRLSPFSTEAGDVDKNLCKSFSDNAITVPSASSPKVEKQKSSGRLRKLLRRSNSSASPSDVPAHALFLRQEKARQVNRLPDN